MLPPLGCMSQLRHYWTLISGSLWFVPLLMSLGAAALAAALMTVGFDAGDGIVGKLLYAGDGDSARNLLGSLLTGMLTMASLVVSITMVVLTLAAGQLGSRLIRRFIDDRITQAVLGLFMATIVYLLVMLRSISGNESNALPHVAIGAGTLLSALCLFVLLFYVHKLARSIVFDNVAASVTEQLAETLGRRERDAKRASATADRARAPADAALPGAGSAAPGPEMFGQAAQVPLGRYGYVQSIAYQALVEAAERADALLWVQVRPGHWIDVAQCCVAVRPASACDEAMRRAVRRAFIVGSERTVTQDLEFGLRQLVEIALRALSPGINDVFTAIAVIDNLSASLARLFDRPMEQDVLSGRNGQPRLVRSVSAWHGLVDESFDQIRQAGAHMPAVAIRLFDAMARLAPHVRERAQLDAVLAQLDAVLESARVGDPVAKDAVDIENRHAEARKALLAGVDRQDRPSRGGNAHKVGMPVAAQAGVRLPEKPSTPTSQGNVLP